MLKKIKSFYNKEGFDYSAGFVDPFEFHQSFYKILVAFKVADLGNTNPPSYFNLNAILFLDVFIAAVVTGTAAYSGLKPFNLTDITEGGTYTLLLIYELLLLYCTRKNLPQFHNLLRAMKQDFHYICTEGQKYRVRYFEAQLKTWKICIIMCVFDTVVAVAINIFAFISVFYFLATHDADTEESRPLLFPFSIPNIDFGKSPLYEVAFIFANITATLYSYNYTFLIQTEIVWIRQITSKVDIVIWSLQDLLVDVYPTTNKEKSEHFSSLIKSRMRDIIIHHQSMYSLMKDYAIVYKKLMLFEQAICRPVICLIAYCIADKIDQGEFQPILLIIWVAAFVLHFIPSLMCTYLSIKVQSVCDACATIPFWNAGPVLRPYLVLMMQRSQQPLPLQAPGFKDISVESFSQDMTHAYSLFNMLRASPLRNLDEHN